MPSFRRVKFNSFKLYISVANNLTLNYTPWEIKLRKARSFDIS